MNKTEQKTAVEQKPTSLKAYFVSLLSLVICCAMFMGTTFAWFSEDVINTGNEIYIGSLQVEFLHRDNGADVPVTETHQVFDKNTKWKPDHAEVELLTVKNTGNLAFEYQLQFLADAANCVFTNGMTMETVAKWFDVYCYNGDPAKATDDMTDPKWKKVGSLKDVLTQGLPVAEGVLENQNDSKVLAIALYLRPDAVNEIMGQKLSINVKLIANQVGAVEYTYAANAAELTAALAEGGYTKLTENVEATAATKAPYGNFYGFAVNGGTLDGSGKTLSVTGSGDTYGIMTNGGTIKNLTIDCGFRGIMLMSAKEDLILERVVISGDGVGYAINTGEHGKAVKLIASHCTFNGWSSFAGLKSASFTNCSFGLGSYWDGTVSDRVVKPYVDTVFADCSFVQDEYIDLSALGEGCKVTFDRCTVGGTVITAENWDDLLDTIELPAGKALADCVIFQ